MKLLLVWYLVAMTVLFTAAMVNMEERYMTEVMQLQARCEQLENKARYYDDVMVTYEFFNEHWTATMRGEVEK